MNTQTENLYSKIIAIMSLLIFCLSCDWDGKIYLEDKSTDQINEDFSDEEILDDEATDSIQPENTDTTKETNEDSDNTGISTGDSYILFLTNVRVPSDFYGQAAQMCGSITSEPQFPNSSFFPDVCYPWPHVEYGTPLEMRISKPRPSSRQETFYINIALYMQNDDLHTNRLALEIDYFGQSIYNFKNDNRINVFRTDSVFLYLILQ